MVTHVVPFAGPPRTGAANATEIRGRRPSPTASVLRTVQATLEREARPRPADDELAEVWDAAAAVLDPELPVLTIADLGMLRGVELDGDVAVVRITPTYSGCPAIDALRADIVTALAEIGREARVEVVLSPAWTTDWMSDEGRRKLEEFGIAPPRPRGADGHVALGLGIRCPQCGSLHTRELSRYGSTSCKALWQCQACGEPFDRFKEL